MTGLKRERSGGQMVVDALVDFGVDRVFCVPGESYLEVLDALYDHGNAIQLINARHEGGAAFMAEAEGKLTGRPGVCLVTRGPGACNASIAVHTAFQDSTPMVLLVGQVSRDWMGREAFQEVDFHAMFGPVAKRVLQVERTEETLAVMARAFDEATSGRPGPVVVVLPEDTLRERAVASPMTPAEVKESEPEPGDMESLCRILFDADRPMMVLGGGGWDDMSRADMAAFAEANDLPVCCSFRRMDLFDNDHSCYAGELGIGPNPKLVERMKEADLIIAVGARLGEMTSQGYSLLDGARAQSNLVHIHADPGELGRVFTPSLGIASGMSAFAKAARGLGSISNGRWKAWRESARRDYEESQLAPDCDDDLDLYRVMQTLRDRIGDHGIVTTDAGNFSGWPQRFLRFGGKRRLLGATSGSMGYGVPAAVAAKLRHPERLVVCCVGDGGFMMTGNEVATAVHYGVAPIILVFENGMYGTIRMHQERAHPGRVIGTELRNPDFAELAKASGAHGETVTRTADFAPAFDRAVASGKASVIALRTNPDRITTRTTLSAIRAAAEQSNGAKGS
ncbi:MAG: thiamine pyrophosphate-binding protein [Rhodospirillales bacterium]|nr:thiamine pyrophosphate-binding protein [Rhodospirillales bacterium]